MPITSFPNGVSSFGIPILGGGGDFTTGPIRFVDSVNGSSSNDGTEPSKAWASIDDVITYGNQDHAPLDANGAIVYLMSGHAETLGATAHTFDGSFDGLSIIGLGNGQSRPAFTFDSASSQIQFTGTSITLRNCRCVATVADIVSGIQLGGDACEADGLIFEIAATIATHGWLIMVEVHTADYAVVRNCQLYASEGDDVAASGIASTTGSSLYTTVVGNFANGSFSAACYTLDATSVTGCLTAGNVFRNTHATGEAVNFQAASTGMCVQNYFSGEQALASNYTFGDQRTINNYVTDADDVNGITQPADAS